VWAQCSIQEPIPVARKAGNTSLPWKFLAMPANGRKVQVFYVAGGGCTTFVGFVGIETSTAVTLTASGDTDLAQKACAADGKTGAGTVTLAGPLGVRTLWHGPVSGQWVSVARLLDGGQRGPGRPVSYSSHVIVVSRFRVPERERASFEAVAAPAVLLLTAQPGLVSIDFGVNLDDPELWALVTKWVDVGSYRRALGSANRPVLWPLLALAIDEASAYDDAEAVGQNIPRTR
jgi:quinol monooxygenase YgiN